MPSRWRSATVIVMTAHRHAVLVVDDTADTRDAMATLLDVLGCEAHTAASGRAALDVLRGGVVPCLILLDVMMPDMDGAEFRRIQRADPALRDIPVVLVTALPREHETPAPLAELSSYQKPAVVGRIADLLREWCPRPGA